MPEKAYRGVPRLRAEEFQPQDDDSSRIQWVRRKWQSQDLLLLNRDRQIEENIRMLAGQQWSVYSKLLGRFVDISHYMSEKERRWRQRPVVNRLLIWFMLTHARMTENPPVVSFQPTTGDKSDADLAEIMDTVYKSLWHEVGMLEVLDRFFSWMIPGGRVHLKSRVDPNIGDIIEWRGPTVLSLETEDGPIERVIDDVPYGRDGEPLIQAGEDGSWEPTGKAFQEFEGGIRVDVLNPLQVRAQWGNDIPWHFKRWMIHRTFLTPEEVYDTYGVDMEPEVVGEEAEFVGTLRRVMFGSGHFSAVEHPGEIMGTHEKEGADGFIDVMEYWEAPHHLEERTLQGPGPDQPGGRLCTVTRTKCLRDGPRPAPFPHTGPIRTVDFVNIPGRPSGTTPQESQNPIQRAFNRGWGQVLEHSNLSANPIGIVDRSTGLKEGDITNEPGLYVYANRRLGSSAPPIEYAKPPQLGEVVYRALGMLRDELQDQGQTEGSRGAPPTRDPSGELVKELRFNDDRFIGPTMRRAALEMGRMIEDWMAILPTIWTEEKVVTYAGEDQVLRTALVAPQLFEQGSVNVQVDVESMLPEGRGERRARIYKMWQDGAFGPPDTPEAIRWMLELSRFPHMGRAVRPGGVHRQMAELENGKLARGTGAGQIPLFEWQDHDVHLAVHEEFMASPDYQKLDVEIQQQFVIHRSHHRQARQLVFAQQLQEEAQRQAAAGITAAAAEGEIAEAETAIGAGPAATPRSVETPEGRPPGEGRGVPRQRPGAGVA